MDVRRLGLASRFWFGGGVWPPFFTASTGLIDGFSRRGGSSSDHHIGESKERVELMPVLGQSPIPHLPMAENILQNVEDRVVTGSHARRLINQVLFVVKQVERIVP